VEKAKKPKKIPGEKSEARQEVGGVEDMDLDDSEDERPGLGPVNPKTSLFGRPDKSLSLPSSVTGAADLSQAKGGKALGSKGKRSSKAGGKKADRAGGSETGLLKVKKGVERPHGAVERESGVTKSVNKAGSKLGKVSATGSQNAAADREGRDRGLGLLALDKGSVTKVEKSMAAQRPTSSQAGGGGEPMDMLTEEPSSASSSSSSSSSTGLDGGILLRPTPGGVTVTSPPNLGSSATKERFREELGSSKKLGGGGGTSRGSGSGSKVKGRDRPRGDKSRASRPGVGSREAAALQASNLVQLTPRAAKAQAVDKIKRGE
ncbi:unnamed protein product, partial [Discosporangium mesarthrocarpum]